MSVELELIRTSLLSALQTVIKILAGFVVMKAVAYFAGPTGLALLGQFQNFVTMVTNLAGGAFSTGITKFASQYQAEGRSRNKLYGSASRATLVLCSGAALVVGFGNEQWSLLLLHDAGYGFVFIVFALFLAFMVLNNLALAALNGERRIGQYIAVNISSSIAMLVGTVLLSALWGLPGALLSVILAPASAFVFAVFALRRDEWPSAALKGSDYNHSELVKISKFALISLLSALVLPAAQMVIREFLVATYSWREAGLWQGVSRISDVYLLLITATFSVYLLPKLSGIDCRDQLREEIGKVLKIALPCALILALFVFLLRDMAIWLLFTDDFREMRDLFAWQLMGDVVKVAAWIFAYVLLAKSKLRLFVIGEILFTISFVLISICLVGWLGLKGVVVAHFVNYCLYFVYVYAAVRLSMKYMAQQFVSNSAKEKCN